VPAQSPPSPSRRIAVLLASLQLVQAAGGFAAETNPPPGDAWFTNSFTWPAFVPPKTVVAADFQTLRATEAAGRLKVYWTPARMDTNAEVSAFTSTDSPGHWPVRDWRPVAAAEVGSNWMATLPVDDPDVPVAYFLSVAAAGKTNFSPLRFADPRRLGIEEPTRFFWPFIEGFEAGLASWRLVTLEAAPLRLDAEAKNGRHALCVPLARPGHPVTVGSTRIRGWRALRPDIRGLSVWLRSRGGPATVRFSLHGNAFTTNEVTSMSSVTGRITEAWQRVEAPFDSFPRLPRAELDWFTLEFNADGPCEILVDDVQFTGSWKLDPE
jgi:hypothetical protein